MSQSEAPKLKTEARLEMIKRGLLEGWTQDKIAEECGVCRETISRDVRAWKITGGLETWVRGKFHDMQDKAEQEDFMGAYREIMKLVARTMTQRTEAKVEGFGQLTIWRPDKPPETPEPEGEGDDQKT